MKTNEFIKEHIKIDNREKISKKISNLSKRFREYSYYLDLIQKESVAKLFILLKKEKYFFYSMIGDEIPRHTFRTYINILLAYDFIEIITPPNNFKDEVANIYNKYVSDKTNYYSLTKKGEDFVNVDYLTQYLETEYSDFISMVD